MITKEEIGTSQHGLSYVVKGMCVQFDFAGRTDDEGRVSYDTYTDKQLDDAASQFALILNLAEWNEELGKNIERHMNANGYDGVASCYKIE